MELFSVKRYNEESLPDSKEKEDEILTKLLKKVERRKRKLKKSEENLGDLSLKDYDIPEDIKEEYINETKHVEADNNLSGILQSPQLDAEEKNQINDDENFKVLGDDVFSKRKKIDMVLPPWLAHPSIIATDLSDHCLERIEDIPYLSKEVKENLSGMQIDKLFPVQRDVIPWLLDAHSKPTPFRPRDICVSAPTGSGKTLAFAVPIVELLSKRIERKIRALIVLPVSELAIQVYKVFMKLAHNTSLSVCLLSKSVQFAAEQNRLVDVFKGKYYSKVDIVITTPGRLVEHLHATKGFCLKNLKFLVIDEADKIMDQIYHNWLYHLDTHVKSTSDMMLSGRPVGLSINDLEGEAQRQAHKLLFSATLSQDPEKLQNLKLFQPKLFTSVMAVDYLAEALIVKPQVNTENKVYGEFVGKYTTPNELVEKYCITETRIKPLTLFSLIKENKWTKFLCFTNTVQGAHRLAFILGFLHYNHLTIAELSASLSPKARSTILKKFAVGVINGIVCSDALARGIDIPEVDVVISYDAPRHIKTYIHRIGRTARAGRPGTAVTLLNTKEFNSFTDILAEAGKKATCEIKVEGNVEEDYAKRYSLALQKLEKTLVSEKYLKRSKKKEAKEKAVKLPSEITTMEKLQKEVSNMLENKNDMKVELYKPNKPGEN